MTLHLTHVEKHKNFIWFTRKR